MEQPAKAARWMPEAARTACTSSASLAMVMVPAPADELAVPTKIDEREAIAVGELFCNRQPEGMVDRRWMDQHHVWASAYRDSK